MHFQGKEHLQQFAEDYMAVWNVADAERRAQRISEIWTEDAIQYTPESDYHGHQILLSRITTNYETFVKAQGLFFRTAGVEAHHDAVRLLWEMLPAGGGEVVGSGVLFLLLSEDGRVRLDYQF